MKIESIEDTLATSLEFYAQFLDPNFVVDEEYIRQAEPGIKTFCRLLSPSGLDQLELLAQRSQQVTQSRFGKVMRLYAPLYVSNYCTNGCVYCGFNCKNDFDRKTLNFEELKREVDYLVERGIRHILLVAGEHPKEVSVSYLQRISEYLREFIPSISIEVSPFSQSEYEQLLSSGVEGLAIYQETYDRELYAKVHPSGKKSDYSWRINTPARAAAAGMRSISLGALIGLKEDWLMDILATAIHIDFMMRNYWRTSYSVSLPRLCDCGGFKAGKIISDHQFAQLIFAWRIAFPDLGINLSTRESSAMRNGLMPLAITSISSESATDPGGYTNPAPEIDGKQFETHDNRTTAEVEKWLVGHNMDPVWKDWDKNIF